VSNRSILVWKESPVNKVKKVVALVVVAVLCALPLAAQRTTEDARAEKRALISDLLKVIDSKQLTQSMMEMLTLRMMDDATETAPSDGRSATPEGKRAMEARAAQRQKTRAMLDRLFARIDYVKYDQEVYVPIFEKHFSADELRELIAFYKTRTGARVAHVIPELAMGALIRGMNVIREDASAVSAEMAKEEEARKPAWDRTMRDIRTIATASEAYATDENHYPIATNMSELKKVLEPVYVRELPEKDGWGEPYIYTVSADRQRYRIVSKGADRQLEFGSDKIEDKPVVRKSQRLEDDLIYQDGSFVQSPAVADQRY
jgi:hypothetical protein